LLSLTFSPNRLPLLNLPIPALRAQNRTENGAYPIHHFDSITQPSTACDSASPIGDPYWRRTPAKKLCKRLMHSTSRTPPITRGRIFSSIARLTSYRDPSAPVRGSLAPYTIVPTRDSIAAPAHMVHGSRVTTRVQSANRHCPKLCDADSRATSSA
jgi:hypothetical protein